VKFQFLIAATMQETGRYRYLLTRWLAMCVLFSATLGSIAPLCAALERVDQTHDCHAVAADSCHGSVCGAEPMRTSIHHCCPAFIALIPSAGVVPIPDYFSGVVFDSPKLSIKDRRERLFRPPRTFS